MYLGHLLVRCLPSFLPSLLSYYDTLSLCTSLRPPCTSYSLLCVLRTVMHIWYNIPYIVDLEDTHFDRHHVYRIEWQPGPNGFLDWWVDDQFLLGIDAKSLNDLTGAIIPEEPMYLVLNTAISHRWGMPEPCDVKNCPCCWVCYDCTNPECQCTLPDGMKNCKNLPAEMQIDYIRVYQVWFILVNSADNLLSCSWVNVLAFSAHWSWPFYAAQQFISYTAPTLP
jgi:hypothetical protein